jgi:hypothetical protein
MSGNFSILECPIGNKNKNNKRFIVADKIYYTICNNDKVKQYASCKINPPRFTINDLQK